MNTNDIIVTLTDPASIEAQFAADQEAEDSAPAPLGYRIKPACDVAMAHASALAERLAAVEAERDELRAVLQEMLKALSEADEAFELEGFSEDGATRAPIRALIAKETGGKA